MESDIDSPLKVKVYSPSVEEFKNMDYLLKKIMTDPENINNGIAKVVNRCGKKYFGIFQCRLVYLIFKCD